MPCSIAHRRLSDIGYWTICVCVTLLLVACCVLRNLILLIDLLGRLNNNSAFLILYQFNPAFTSTSVVNQPSQSVSCNLSHYLIISLSYYHIIVLSYYHIIILSFGLVIHQNCIVIDILAPSHLYFVYMHFQCFIFAKLIDGLYYAININSS